ncbi:hypothetical protein ACSNOH_25345 [Streptomyces sp. URMC 127]|uniref:hypothetical protein n=1 Tax=Streptomyces sp. URMC 127 TaxID=3423402 RepID=UPI003F1D0C4F
MSDQNQNQGKGRAAKGREAGGEERKSGVKPEKRSGAFEVSVGDSYISGEGARWEGNAEATDLGDDLFGGRRRKRDDNDKK